MAMNKAGFSLLGVKGANNANGLCGDWSRGSDGCSRAPETVTYLIFTYFKEVMKMILCKDNHTRQVNISLISVICT